MTQGMMWRSVYDDGTLMYSFVESLQASYPFYFMRFIGGLFVVSGMGVMAYNVYCTMRVTKPAMSDQMATAKTYVRESL